MRTADATCSSGSGGGGVFNLPGETFINLIGSHNDVDLWSGGTRTSRVEVDLVGGSGATITGIDATGFKDGDFLFLWNGGGGTVPEDTLTLVNQSALSLAANRIWVPNGKVINIPNNDGVFLIYVGNSWTVFAGSDSIVRAQQLSLDPSATPVALANGSTTNDYNPFGGTTTVSYVKQDTGLRSTITGISAAGAPNSEGRVLVFQNISTTGTIIVKNNNVGSIADNRILCPLGQDLFLGPQASITLIYDDTVAMWRVVAAYSATSASRQNFLVTRQVGDTDTLTIDASRGLFPRANTTYNVLVTLGANSLGVGIVGCDPANFTTTQFVLKLTSAWAAGDSAMITVEARS